MDLRSQSCLRSRRLWPVTERSWRDRENSSPNANQAPPPGCKVKGEVDPGGRQVEGESKLQQQLGEAVVESMRMDLLSLRTWSA